jgi:hypothetical protein
MISDDPFWVALVALVPSCQIHKVIKIKGMMQIVALPRGGLGTSGGLGVG